MAIAFGREMYDAPENPIIANYLRTGYPYSKEPEYPCCPECGEECDTLYRDRHGRVLGCENCIQKVDAWEEVDAWEG